MDPMTSEPDSRRGSSRGFRPEKLTIMAPVRIRFRFVLKLIIMSAMSCGRAALCLWMDSPCRCADSANHITSSGQARIPARAGPSGDCGRQRRVMSACVAPAMCVSTRIRFFQRQGRDGMSLLEGIIESRNNPLAVVEDIAAEHDWAFERSGEDEVTIVSKGNWTDYQLSFTWMGEIEALHLACAFDMKTPPARRAEVQRLIAAINEQLWVGHFDIWTHTGMIMYRQALVLPGGLTASAAQCETMLVSAIHACERYYPAFQFVVWAGKTPAEAMSAAMFDTEGEA